MYKGLAIGGTLFDGVPNESATVDRYISFVNELDPNNSLTSMLESTKDKPSAKP